MNPNTDYQFTIVSPKYGSFVVTAPLAFEGEIKKYTWCIQHDATRTLENRFVVMATGRYIDGKRWHHLLHRLIWQLAGNPPVKAIDHIDGSPLNNSLSNLRDGSIGNAQNRPNGHRNNTSGVHGVFWSKAHQKWRACVTATGKKTHLGLFPSLQEAQHARDIAALKQHGGFASLNAPDAWLKAEPENDNGHLEPCTAITPEEYRALLECFANAA